LEYNNQHSHREQRYEASKSIVKCKITDKIINSPNPYNVNTKRVYDGLIEGMDIFPPYDTIKSQLARTKRKLLELLPDIKNFDEIPDESEYYKTKSDESYMIFKNNNLIIFQSPFQAVLFSKYEDVFADGTFYIAPIFTNQVFITRTFVKELNGFYTTSFSILENKSQITYETLFEEIKKNSSKYNNNNEITPKIFHCDFERAITNAIENVFPNANIKYCIWHFKISI